MKLRIAFKVLDEIYSPTRGRHYRRATLVRALRRALGGEATIELPPLPAGRVLYDDARFPDELADLSVA